MKREILILNVVCLALALAFLVFVVYNALTADSFSSFLTIDNLFITAFCLLMFLIFISMPFSWMLTTGVIRLPFIGGGTDAADTGGKTGIAAGAKAPAAIGPGNTAATSAAAAAPAALPARREIQKDAKGRPIPADVQSMVAEMNKSGQKTS
jgi:hypothetical protein